MACQIKEYVEALQTKVTQNTTSKTKKTLQAVVDNLVLVDITSNVKPKIDIWSYAKKGTPKTGFESLSNINAGPITIKKIDFPTIESAFQYTKAKFAGDTDTAEKILSLNNKPGRNGILWNTADKLKDLKIDGFPNGSSTGIIAQRLGQNVIGLDKEAWDAKSTNFMKLYMTQYYTTNQQAQELLLSTGTDELTHKKVGSASKWKKEFPKLLMQIREDLRKLESQDRTNFTDNTLSSKVNLNTIVEQIINVNKGKPAEKHTFKEVKKAEIATQYIGKGSMNSSTHRYSKVYGDKANTGIYTKDDIVWVSSNGKRGNRIDPLSNKGIKDLLDKAIESEATIVMDTEAHIAKTKWYNIGEIALAKYMISRDYIRSNVQGVGMWTKQEGIVVSNNKLESQNNTIEPETGKTSYDKIIKIGLEKSDVFREFMQDKDVQKVFKQTDKFIYDPVDIKIGIPIGTNKIESEIVESLEHEIEHYKTVAYMADHKDTPLMKNYIKIFNEIKNDKTIQNRISDDNMVIYTHIFNNKYGDNHGLAEMVAIAKSNKKAIEVMYKAVKKPLLRNLVNKLVKLISNIDIATVDIDVKALKQAIADISKNGAKYGQIFQRETANYYTTTIEKNKIQNQTDTSVIQDNKFDTTLNKKLQDIFKKLFPNIILNYTTKDIDPEGGLNQEQVDTNIKLALKVVESLNEVSKYRDTIRLNTKDKPYIEKNLRKLLNGKGVPNNQIELMFEYMRQNDIEEISTKDLAEQMMLGLTSAVEIKTATRKEKDTGTVNTKDYENLTVPGGQNYREVEISTPNVAPVKGHAQFATENGIGWYRVDDGVESNDKTLRVLEMQSDMFQKMKDQNLTDINFSSSQQELQDRLRVNLQKIISKLKKDLKDLNRDEKSSNGLIDSEVYAGLRTDLTSKIKDFENQLNSLGNKNLDKSFLQLFNTDNKWVRFFIQSLVQDAAKKGYENIRLPSGETAAKVEGHESIAEQIKSIDRDIRIIKEDGGIPSIDGQDSDVYIPGSEKSAKLFLNKLEKKKKELKTQGIEKLAPIEGFYQNRVRNTLIKTYGKENVKTVTDEHGNSWFELSIDPKRDSKTIMLQKTTNLSRLDDGDTINLFSQIDMADNKHITFEFNPENHANTEGPTLPGKVGSKVKVKVIGHYKDSDMEYRTVEITVDGKTYTKQPSGTTLHITDYVNKENDIKPFMTGKHATENPSLVKKASGSISGTVSVATGKYNSKFDKTIPQGQIKGQANIEAQTVLINSLLQSQDTLPHEYAHHYIAMFRNAPIVQEAIKKWGSEEKLVQAIGEQVVTQKGEVYGWWKKFSKWVQEVFNTLDEKSREDLRNLLTDSFLTNEDLNTEIIIKKKINKVVTNKVKPITVTNKSNKEYSSPIGTKQTISSSTANELGVNTLSIEKLAKDGLKNCK